MRPAFAQKGPSAKALELRPEIAQCVNDCLLPATAPADDQTAVLAMNLAKLTRQLADLQKQVGLLASKKADPAAMAALRSEIRKIDERLETLTKAAAKDAVDLGLRDEALEKSLKELTELSAALTARVAVLEKKGGGVHVGLGAGFEGFWATNHLSYTGLPVVARLKLNLTDSVDVDIDAGGVFSFSHNPVGTIVRGGLSFDLNDKFAIETGLSGHFVGYNNQMLAKAAFVMADGGVAFRYGLFQATARVLLGSEFDSHKPAFALGGALTAGVMLP